MKRMAFLIIWMEWSCKFQGKQRQAHLLLRIGLGRVPWTSWGGDNSLRYRALLPTKSFSNKIKYTNDKTRRSRSDKCIVSISFKQSWFDLHPQLFSGDNFCTSMYGLNAKIRKRIATMGNSIDLGKLYRPHCSPSLDSWLVRVIIPKWPQDSG